MNEINEKLKLQSLRRKWLYSELVWSECREIQTGKIPNTDISHAVLRVQCDFSLGWVKLVCSRVKLFRYFASKTSSMTLFKIKEYSIKKKKKTIMMIIIKTKSTCHCELFQTYICQVSYIKTKYLCAQKNKIKWWLNDWVSNQ